MNSISQTTRQLNKEFPGVLRLAGVVDAVIATIIIVGCVATIPFLRSIKPDNVVIYKENRIIATYPLAINNTITVTGALGPVTFTIKDHTVAISQVTCPQHICKKTGAISRAHSQIVCAPNHLLLTIASTTKDSIDGIAR